MSELLEQKNGARHDPRSLDAPPELLRRHRRYHGRLHAPVEVLHTGWPVARLRARFGDSS